MNRKSLLTTIALASIAVSPAAFAEKQSKTFAVDEFDSIVVTGPVVAKITQGDRESVSAVFDDKVADRVYAVVKNGTLEVGIKEKTWKMFNFSSEITFTIEADDLNKLVATGSSDVETSNLTSNKLTIGASGATSVVTQNIDVDHLKLRLSGSSDLETQAIKADSVSVSISGSGDLNSRQIETGTVDISLSGSADANIDRISAQELEAKITGSGTVKVIEGGTVERQEIVVTGAADYIAKSLESKTAKVKLSGASNATVFVTEHLKGYASGASDIAYYGRPIVEVSTSGASDVTHKGMK